jgi:hypothetical protein
MHIEPVSFSFVSVLTVLSFLFDVYQLNKITVLLKLQISTGASPRTLDNYSVRPRSSGKGQWIFTPSFSAANNGQRGLRKNARAKKTASASPV